MKTRYLITFYFALMCNTAFAQTASTYFCSAPWPPPAGTDRTMGKDNNGNVCIRIAKDPPEVISPVAAPTAPPVASAPEVAKPAIAPPSKDLLGQAAISVTLAQDEQGRPVLQAICPDSGFNEWDFKALEAGFRQKVVTRGKETFIIYEK